MMSGQLDLRFYNYLDEHNLKREQETYMNTLLNVTSSDTLSYLKARFYLEYYNDSLFFDNYTKSKILFLNDTMAFTKANIQFLRSNTEQQKNWFKTLENETFPFASNQIKNVYVAVQSPKSFNMNDLPLPLQNDFLKYKITSKKNAYLAGTLSAVVPGLGKFYAGRKKSFLAALFVNGIFAAQTYESVDKLGIRHPFSILSLGVFSVFYLSNIYGSYYDVAQVKEETKNQFIINASDYFNSTYIKH